MAEQIVLNWTDPNSVRKVVKVKAPPESGVAGFH